MRICIDPGHGMGNRTPGVFDPGAVDLETGTREADIALKYGLALKDEIRARGISVFMTRDDNEDPAPLNSRAGAAESVSCDLFVSLHMNAAEDPSAHGTETLFSDDRDKALAQVIQKALNNTLGLRDRGLKHRPELAVLKFAGPAALVELGFISNDGDRNKILQPHTRSAVCEAVAVAVVGHLQGVQPAPAIG